MRLQRAASAVPDTDLVRIGGYAEAMLPIRHRSIFKSRWVALLWAAGILWSAIEFVGTGSDRPTSADDVNAASAVLG